MKKAFPPSCMLAPLPAVMVSCGPVSTPNIITIAWTGIINSVPPRTYVSIRPQRYSHGLIKSSGELVINLVPQSLVRAADFCGVRTGNTAFSTSARGKNIEGRRFDKFAACGLTPAASTVVAVPSIAQCPVSLECRVFDIIPLGSHDMVLCDILAVTVEEALIDDSGRICLERAGLVSFAHGEYFAPGGPIERMGFSVKGKK